jgi:hypothetical protein
MDIKVEKIVGSRINRYVTAGGNFAHRLYRSAISTERFMNMLVKFAKDESGATAQSSRWLR